jgi:hypothetical protein
MALLEDEGKSRNLVALVKPHARRATVGAWIPDQVDAKRGGNKTENHVLKMEPYEGKTGRERFVADKKALLARVTMDRRLARYVDGDTVLSSRWWSAPYRGDVPKPGMHLPNRAMAVSTMLKDLLLAGNSAIDDLVPGAVGFIEDLDPEAKTREAAAAVYFFMLSHFMADACMPCHCDARKICSYGGGFTADSHKRPVHKTWEAHWSEKIGSAWKRKHLLKDTVAPSPDELLDDARQVDPTFGIEFAGRVPDLPEGTDVWLDSVNLCRLSFAVMSTLASPADYPYEAAGARVAWDELFQEGSERLKELDRAILHDAVLNTAMVWKHVWTKVSKL